ncbi:hypothetical protein [Actinoplanes sp. NPDC020271]|uniref:hypothetical protein n=1 Tax=Actinoplanes sp. NPDC020271 TaxID=3363896 RepID=UPI00378D5B07
MLLEAAAVGDQRGLWFGLFLIGALLLSAIIGWVFRAMNVAIPAVLTISGVAFISILGIAMTSFGFVTG